MPEKHPEPTLSPLRHNPEPITDLPQHRAANGPLTPDGVLALQHAIGNAAVRRMISTQKRRAVQRVSGGPSAEDLAEAVKYNKSRGLSQDTIKAIQRIIGVNDDGEIGLHTVRALIRWQAQNGLDPDGKIGSQTLARLAPVTTTSVPAVQTPPQGEAQAGNAPNTGKYLLTGVEHQSAHDEQGGGFLDSIINTGKNIWDTMTNLFSSGVETSGDTKSGNTTGNSRSGTPGSNTPAVDPKKAELEALMTKGRLTPEEIRQARLLIEQNPDAEHRGDLYEALQAKVEYHSQRDNKSKDAAGKSIGDVMCNLTSLSMVLSYLGVPNPDPKMQYEDALEKIRVDKKLPARTMKDGWGGVAKELGVDVIWLGDSVVQGHDWYAQNVLPHLRAGHSVMLSVTGHIVRLQAVTDTGLIMDDPYGKEKLLAGTKHKWEGYNKRGEASNVGEDSVWPWEDVSKHSMLWIAAFKLH